MQDAPFSIFAPFGDRVHVHFFSKSDHICSDEYLCGALKEDKIASLTQVHGARTVVVRQPMHRTEEADGLLTDTPGLTLSIRAADCQQIVVYAPTQHVCGVLHAGWRGLLEGCIPSFFGALKDEWGIAPGDTVVGIGPSLCTNCSVFTDPARELPGIDRQFIDGRNVNLRGWADLQLATLGIPAGQRERHPDCTRCRGDLYWTYRGGDILVREGTCRNAITCRLTETFQLQKSPGGRP